MIWIILIFSIAVIIYLSKKGTPPNTPTKNIDSVEKNDDTGKLTYLIFKEKFPKEERVVSKFTDCLANHKDFFIPESAVGYNLTTIEQALDKAIAVSKELEDNETTVIFYNVKSNLKLVIPDDRAKLLNESYEYGQEGDKSDTTKFELFAVSDEMRAFNEYSIKILTELKDKLGSK